MRDTFLLLINFVCIQVALMMLITVIMILELADHVFVLSFYTWSIKLPVNIVCTEDKKEIYLTASNRVMGSRCHPQDSIYFEPSNPPHKSEVVIIKKQKLKKKSVLKLKQETASSAERPHNKQVECQNTVSKSSSCWYKTIFTKWFSNISIIIL